MTGFGTVIRSALPALTFWHPGQPLSLEALLPVVPLLASVRMCMNWPRLHTDAWFRLQLSVTLSLNHIPGPITVSPVWTKHTWFHYSGANPLQNPTELHEFSSGSCWMCVALIHKVVQFQEKRCSAESKQVGVECRREGAQQPWAPLSWISFVLLFTVSQDFLQGSDRIRSYSLCKEFKFESAYVFYMVLWPFPWCIVEIGTRLDISFQVCY